jgi:hypothetical protein
MRSRASVSLADLSAAGLRLRPTEAVTIVRSLALQVARGELPGMPSPHVIRLLPSGTITVEGPVASGRPVPRAAQLLAGLLPESTRNGVEPTPLRRVIARAQMPGGDGYASLDELAAALATFAAHDPVAAISDLTARWAEAVRDADDPEAEDAPVEGDPVPGPARETSAGVSEMRRARRETGLSLQEISKKSRIPVSMLRQLEWGYLRNWPTGLYGRTQLVRYARAAGINQQAVVEAVWPLLEAQARERAAGDAGGPATAAAPEPIIILQSGFEDDEVLFEPEMEAGDVLPVVANPPVEAEPVKHDAPRRASMAAVAALLAVVTGGTIWGMRWHPLANEPSRPAAEQVRRIPPIADAAAPGETASTPLPVSERAAARAPSPLPTLSRRRSAAIPTAGMRLTPAVAADDELFGYSPAFESPGGAAFSEPTQADAAAAGDAGSALGLRITRVVDEESRNYHARPSPDGTRVAFDSDRDGDRGVFVADASGQNLRRISGDGFAAVPNWSPDGHWLSYVHAESDNQDVWNLWMQNVDSGETRRLTSNTTGRPLGGTWFPDGRRIAYARGGSIVVLDVDGGKTTVYPSPQPGRAARAPAVSPDGRWIAFQLSGDGAWLLDLTNGSTLKVLSDSTAEEFTWSPDSSRIAYYSRRDAEWSVWVMAAR